MDGNSAVSDGFFGYRTAIVITHADDAALHRRPSHLFHLLVLVGGGRIGLGDAKIPKQLPISHRVQHTDFPEKIQEQGQASRHLVRIQGVARSGVEGSKRYGPRGRHC